MLTAKLLDSLLLQEGPDGFMASFVSVSANTGVAAGVLNRKNLPVRATTSHSAFLHPVIDERLTHHVSSWLHGYFGLPIAEKVATDWTERQVREFLGKPNEDKWQEFLKSWIRGGAGAMNRALGELGQSVLDYVLEWRSKKEGTLPFLVAILDESGQAPPEIESAATANTISVCYAGDLNQTGPVSKNREDEGTLKSALELAAEKPETKISVLDVNYRACSPSLRAVVKAAKSFGVDRLADRKEIIGAIKAQFGVDDAVSYTRELSELDIEELVAGNGQIIVWRNVDRISQSVQIRQMLGLERSRLYAGEPVAVRSNDVKDSQIKAILGHGKLWVAEQDVHGHGACFILNGESGIRGSVNVYFELVGGNPVVGAKNWYYGHNAVKLALGYAITAHSTQGSEWPTVFVHYPSFAGIWDFDRVSPKEKLRWAYTCFSRARQRLIFFDNLPRQVSAACIDRCEDLRYQRVARLPYNDTVIHGDIEPDPFATIRNRYSSRDV